MTAAEAEAKGVPGVAGTARTKTGTEVVEDLIYESPVDIHQMRTRRIAFWSSLVVVVGLVVYCVAT